MVIEDFNQSIVASSDDSLSLLHASITWLCKTLFMPYYHHPLRMPVFKLQPCTVLSNIYTAVQVAGLSFRIVPITSMIKIHTSSTPWWRDAWTDSPQPEGHLRMSWMIYKSIWRSIARRNQQRHWRRKLWDPRCVCMYCYHNSGQWIWICCVYFCTIARDWENEVKAAKASKNAWQSAGIRACVVTL